MSVLCLCELLVAWQDLEGEQVGSEGSLAQEKGVRVGEMLAPTGEDVKGHDVKFIGQRQVECF